MAIRFKQEPDTEQQQFEKWKNSQSTIANTDKQEFSNLRSKRSPVFRHNQLSQVLTNFQVNHSHRWQGWARRWENFDFRTKLAIVLVGSTAISSTIVAQGVVTIASHKLAEQVQESLQPDISLLEQSLKLQMRGNEDIAVGMAQTVLETGLNLNKKEDIKFARELLEDQKHFNNPEQSFRAIIDAHGRTVAQSVQILQSDSSDNSSLGSEKQDKPKYRRISLRPEIKLGDIPIVKDVLKTGRMLTGTELLGAESILSLGLETQANIGFHLQETQNLSEHEKPYPENKYDSSGGLVLMAVQPIKEQGKIIGAVVVGTLLNRNYQIVDSLSQHTGGLELPYLRWTRKSAPTFPIPKMAATLARLGQEPQWK